jgi:3-methyladenine DNA glycosylase AlkC
VAHHLKDFFGQRVVRGIARSLKRAHPVFAERAFIEASLDGLDQHELLARGWHITEAMRRYLPSPFEAAGRVLLDALAHDIDHPGSAMAPFRYLPHVFFVQKYGLDDFELAMRLQYELTQRFSAEFSIRPYLERYPDATLARLRVWASDPNEHVRRLVSEGTRPRLPWAARVRAFLDDPTPVLSLLELLKDDTARYVQRSVANNLNDIAKDHPDVVVATCRRWLQAPGPGTAYIVRHALRSLVKRGHPGALRAVGAGAPPRIEISHLRLPKRVRVGEKLRFGFSLRSTSARPQTLEVDYTVHFLKADGNPRPKVFKLRRMTLAPRETVELTGSVSFAQLTTRKHYPGRHRIEVTVNGVRCSEGAVTVLR